MLVLTRHRDEVVVIDLRKHGLGLCKVTLVDIRDGYGGIKVRLGFDFPADVPVNRQEVFDVIEAEGKP